MPCGEHKTRECADGKPTQNSFARMAGAVGLRPRASR